MHNPLVDISTINAIESLYRHGVHDPWAKQLAGEFADLFVYSSTIRYSITIPSANSDDQALERPSLLLDFIKRDSGLLTPAKFSTANPVKLNDEYLIECFNRFAAWARSNKKTLRTWISLHNQDWIQKQYAARVKHEQHEWSFSLEALLKEPELVVLAKELGIAEHDVCYAFDLVLRYPLYGELAGLSEHYLNHPIRDAFLLPTMKREEGSPPFIAVSFKDTLRQFADKLSKDDYSVLLHELRGAVHEYGLHLVGPGEFDKDVVREIAAKVALPPKLRASGKLAAIGAGIVGSLGALPILGPSAAIVGGVLSVSTALWSGRLPRTTARMRWLKWALEWDIEEQAEKRE